MLGGSVSGGYVAQLANLGVPYLVRSVVLALTLALAFARMRDVGFTPEGGGRTLEKMRGIVAASIEHGWKVPAVKWTMLAAPLTGGVSIYAFYALQPYVLELYGDPSAYGVAGLAAAVVAGAEILGGFAAPRIRHALVVVRGLLWAALGPIRQAYINEPIPSRQRPTILSFDSLMGSSGGVVIQPALGRAADVWSYATSYLLGAAVNALALPFILRARRENVAADSARGATRRAC